MLWTGNKKHREGGKNKKFSPPPCRLLQSSSSLERQPASFQLPEKDSQRCLREEKMSVATVFQLCTVMQKLYIKDCKWLVNR